MPLAVFLYGIYEAQEISSKRFHNCKWPLDEGELRPTEPQHPANSYPK